MFVSSAYSCYCISVLVYCLCVSLQVDYGSTAEELESHFHGCGAVSRVTILCDRFTGHPKGFAFIHVHLSPCNTICVHQCFYPFLFTCKFYASLQTSLACVSTNNYHTSVSTHVDINYHSWIWAKMLIDIIVVKCTSFG